MSDPYQSAACSGHASGSSDPSVKNEEPRFDVVEVPTRARSENHEGGVRSETRGVEM